MGLSYHEFGEACFPIMGIYLGYLALISALGLNLVHLFNAKSALFIQKKSYIELFYVGLLVGIPVYLGYLYLLEVLGRFSALSTIYALIISNVLLLSINIFRIRSAYDPQAPAAFRQRIKNQRNVWVRNLLGLAVALSLVFIRYAYYTLFNNGIVFPDSHHWAAISFNLVKQGHLSIFPLSQGLPLLLAPLIYLQPTVGFTLLLFKWLPLINMLLLIGCVWAILNRLVDRVYLWGLIATFIIMGNEYFNYRSIGLLPTYYTVLLMTLGVLACCIPALSKGWAGLPVGCTILFHPLYGSVILIMFLLYFSLNLFSATEPLPDSQPNKEGTERTEQNGIITNGNAENKAPKFHYVKRGIIDVTKFVFWFVCACAPFFISSVLKFGTNFYDIYLQLLYSPTTLRISDHNPFNQMVYYFFTFFFKFLPQYLGGSLENYQAIYASAPSSFNSSLIYFTSRTGKDLMFITPVLVVFPFRRVMGARSPAGNLSLLLKSVVIGCIGLYFCPNAYLFLHLENELLKRVFFSFIWQVFRDRLMELLPVPFAILTTLLFSVIWKWGTGQIEKWGAKMAPKFPSKIPIERGMKVGLLIALVAYPAALALRANYEVDLAIDGDILNGIYEFDLILQERNPDYEERREIKIGYVYSQDVRFLLAIFMGPYYTLVQLTGMSGKNASEIVQYADAKNCTYLMYDHANPVLQPFDLEGEPLESVGDVRYINRRVIIVEFPNA